jgi:hypothetical protein
MQPAKINYKIYQGSTFQEVYRWESQTKVYVPIQNIAKSAPCVVSTSEPHNVPQGWRIRVVGAGGMKEINSVGEQFQIATEVTDSTITLNQVNSLQYTTYTSGGVVEYGEPVDLADYSARMQIRETVDSPEVIYEATSASSQILLNNTSKTITLTLLGNVTSEFNFTTAVYSIELYNGNNVIPFLIGNLTLVPEVTR